MRENFECCLKNVLAKEGGWSNNPNDPGGATMKGVTQRVYDSWRRRKGLPLASVRGISDGEVAEIYKTQYWDAVRGDEVPRGIDNCLFDEAVNSGPIRSVMDLQAVLGVSIDGHFGILTMGALQQQAAQSGGSARIINAICDRRLSWLRRLTIWRWFGKGLASRVASVRAESLVMA